ncbi:hypothetical protein L4O78_002333 [Pseudomonas aeruginosa]|uniref:hypothetical protein n=1 Tax=Pseudomonas aeruginosa TaxID=287 RepID=UPI0003B98259|nr:hypothetical protein [Pseudomonas aeruginosa]EIU2893489.1 hypothetical protein [Pseudomonas aeruginosa]EIU2920079.1 hypothetical protein [Pseudomonas aeruginosa]EKU2414937.1 hypothetical protein [Pseudomonas aeruginosa]EKU3897040.1 hypothetical protein [Pseudomonas aeruginosa]EKU7562735.1 hypothetical protein [Pseudomonas aeruginosa]
MLPAPRIVAVDDKKDELEALTDALSRTGAACLGVLFNAEEGRVEACPDARVIFFDLHLLGDAVGSPEKHFSTIVSCLEQMGPQGPYAIIVWSQHSDEADGDDSGNSLYQYICERLDRAIPRPYVVMPLPKVEHLSRLEGVYVVAKPELLRVKVDELLSSHPQASALLLWEKYVLSAAAGTVAQLIDLSGGRAEQIKGVMASLATAAVGKRNVDQDRFYALNEALLPILSDRLDFFASAPEDLKIWENAFAVQDYEAISPEKIGKINKFINLSMSAERLSAADRGAVIPYDSILGEGLTESVEGYFGLKLGEIVTRCFGIKSLKDFNGARWILLQSQAACDYAQKKPQMLSYFLGLEVSSSAVRDSRSGDAPPLPESLWVSPVFSIDDADKVLLFNAGSLLVFPVDLISSVRPVYRLREQILNDLLFKLRNHQSRPGIISLF